jgi:hypothetical protein
MRSQQAWCIMSLLLMPAPLLSPIQYNLHDCVLAQFSSTHLQAKLSAALHALEEVRKQNDANIDLIGEIIPALDGAHTQLFSIFGFTPSPTKA